MNIESVKVSGIDKQLDLKNNTYCEVALKEYEIPDIFNYIQRLNTWVDDEDVFTKVNNLYEFTRSWLGNRFAISTLHIYYTSEEPYGESYNFNPICFNGCAIKLINITTF